MTSFCTRYCLLGHTHTHTRSLTHVQMHTLTRTIVHEARTHTRTYTHTHTHTHTHTRFLVPNGVLFYTQFTEAQVNYKLAVSAHHTGEKSWRDFRKVCVCVNNFYWIE